MALVRFVTVVFVTTVCSLAPTQGQVESFSNNLIQLVNSLSGADRFRTHLQSLRYLSSPVNGSKYVQSIADDINKDAKVRADVVTELKKEIVEIYKDSALRTRQVKRCCPPVGLNLKPDPRFYFKTDSENLCSYGEPPKGDDERYSDELLGTMQQKFNQIPQLKWQSFGNERGVLYVYPALNTCDEYNISIAFDPRLRPWYSFTAAYPKDVIIMLDKSHSTSQYYLSSGITKLEVALRAAQAAIDSLNPNDNVGLISFAETVEHPTVTGIDCYSRQLARATPTNRKKLSDYVITIRSSLKTANYSQAFHTVFDLFTASANLSISNKRKTILLIADGKPADSLDSITQAIAEGSAELGQNVHILAFGLNTDPDSNAILTNISAQSGGGRFTDLTNPDLDEIRTKIGVYYNYFAKTGEDRDTVVFSVPYNDSLGLGMITSAGLSVVAYNEFKGVTETDIPINTIFREITDFRLSGASYAFVVDARGRMLLHPLLPKPETYMQEPIFLDMESVETSPDATLVKQYMMSGSTGNLSMSSFKIVLPRGSSPSEGVIYAPWPATYYWAPIPLMNMSVGLVIVNNETNVTMTWDASYPDIFLADELETERGATAGTCNNFGRIAQYDKSAVKLSPHSFVGEYYYTLQDISSYIPQFKLYLQARRSSLNNLDVRTGVRESIAATYMLEDIWKSNRTQLLGECILSRYIGTEQGVYRVYPAVRVPKDYDPTRQTWYLKAAAQKSGLFTVLTSGNSNKFATTTLSVAIMYHTGNVMAGVVGIDLSFACFYEYLTTHFSPCKPDTASCFAIDRSGFVVAHIDFLSSPPSSAVHVTTKEPQIASELIDAGIMTNDSCLSYADITQQLFWILWKSKITDSGHEMASSYIYSIDGFDLLVIAKKSSPASSSRCTCQFALANEYGKIPCSSERKCQCPCYSITDYSYCSGQFTITSATKPCYQSNVQLYLRDLSAEESSSLSAIPPCVECSLIKTESECTTTGCCWFRNEPESSAECRKSCTQTTETSTESTAVGSDAHSGCSSTCLGLAIGLPVGAVFIAAIVAVGVLVFRNAKNRRKAAEANKNRTVIPVTRVNTDMEVVYITVQGRLADNTAPRLYDRYLNVSELSEDSASGHYQSVSDI